jgi:hypothetical protein
MSNDDDNAYCGDGPHHDLCCCNDCTPDNQPPQPQEDSNNV